MQEELRKIDKTLLKVIAIKTTQLLEGWSLHFSWIRCGHLHNFSALAISSQVQPHSIPTYQLQAWYKDLDLGLVKIEISIFSKVPLEPIPKRITSPSVTSIRQPLLDIIPYKASFTDPTSVQVDISIFYGLVQSLDSHSLNWSIIKDNRCLSRPVFMVWGW